MTPHAKDREDWTEHEVSEETDASRFWYWDTELPALIIKMRLTERRIEE